LATLRPPAEAEADVQRQEIAHLMRVSMLGELSGGLAHELTQPLTAILSNAQAGKMLLAKGSKSLSEIGNILDDIIASELIDRRMSVSFDNAANLPNNARRPRAIAANIAQSFGEMRWTRCDVHWPGAFFDQHCNDQRRRGRVKIMS
jgi:C4-dicarboxylate-specific signal transduction histidine kinase